MSSEAEAAVRVDVRMPGCDNQGKELFNPQRAVMQIVPLFGKGDKNS